jgi:hypothetical protein
MSTKFAVLHQLGDLDRRYEVSFEGASFHIAADKFEDEIIYNGKNLLMG